jgi:hypothetical protein
VNGATVITVTFTAVSNQQKVAAGKGCTTFRKSHATQAGELLKLKLHGRDTAQGAHVH